MRRPVSPKGGAAGAAVHGRATVVLRKSASPALEAANCIRQTPSSPSRLNASVAISAAA